MSITCPCILSAPGGKLPNNARLTLCCFALKLIPMIVRKQSSSPSSISMAFTSMSLPKEGALDSPSIGSTASGQSLDRHQNPFQFFDRIDQEIEENKQRLKETIPVTRAQNSEVYANGPLDAHYEHSQAKQGGYNAFFNIHFDQFSTKSHPSLVPPIATTTNKAKTNGYNAFSNEAAIPNPSTGHKKASGECPKDFPWINSNLTISYS